MCTRVSSINTDSSFCVNKPNLSLSQTSRSYGLSLLAILNYITPHFIPVHVHFILFPPQLTLLVSWFSYRSHHLISINDILKLSSELGINNFQKSLLPKHQGYFCFPPSCHIPNPCPCISLALHA